MKTTMPDWLRRIVTRLLLITMVISAAGLTFAREILEDGPTGSESVISMASADQHDGQFGNNGVATKACDHSCHNTNHFLGQSPEDRIAALPPTVRQFVPRIKRLASRDHAEPPFRPPRFPA